MTVRVISPYSQEVVEVVANDDHASADAKIAAAALAQAHWSRLSVADRAARIRVGLETLRERTDAIVREVTLQMGKPLAEARGEMATLMERAEWMLDAAEEALAPDVLPAKEGFLRRIEHVPLGVVFNVAAWNYPLIIPINVIVPALAAGNAVILKHSAKTPLVGRRFEEAFGALEPAGLLANLVLSHEDTERVIADPRIHHVSFTGSVAGGHQVYRAAARRFIDVGLELGGKDPAYVAADADVDFAAAGLVEGACYNAGQSCCAVERAYVHADVYDAFMERARGHLEALVMGDPLEDETTLGPLASQSALEFLEAQVRDAESRGAQVLIGGKRVPDTSGNFFPPTLISGVPNDADVMQEESFGPILPVMKVADDEEALRCMNDTQFGLTASVWTRDGERAERFARQLDAGTVFQNRCDYLDPALPWTGARDSGKGSTLSRYGYFHLTRRKSLHFRRGN